MNSLIRILLIDDSPYFLVAARDFLAMHKVFEIAGEVQDGTNALARALEIQPDVILLDLNLGSESGMELIPLLKKHLPLTRIVVLTIQDEPGYRAASLEAGADAFVNKMHMTQDLIATIFSIVKAPLISKEQPASLQKERDAMFLRLIENADDLIYRYEFSPRRGFTYVNAAAATITGYTPEEHYADPDLGFKLIYPEDRPLLEQALLGKLEPHQPLILRWVRKDGSIFWTEQRNVNIYNRQGDLTAIEGIARDITHRIQTEELLKVSEQFTREALDSLKNHIAILDETGTIMMVNRSWREFAGTNGVDADAVSEGINYLSVCDTATGEGSHQAAAMAAGIRSVMRGELESYFLEYPCHSPNEKRWFIVRVTKFKGEKPLRIVVDHENLTEQKINEQAIVRSEARYRELFEANPHPMWVYDLETLHFLAVNDTAISHYGYTREQFYSMTIKDIHPEKDVERLLENIAQVTNGADEAGIWSHIKKNGDVIQVEITSHVIDFDGRRAEIVLANDVTERLHAEQERNRLFNYSIDMLCIADFNGYFKQLNPAWEKTLGWTSTELQSKPYLEFVHPEDHEATINAKGSLVDGKTIFTFENRYLCRDGTYKWISWNSYPLVEEGLIFGVAHDVTERKHAEEALRISEARYHALIDQLPAIVYLDDLQTSLPKTQFVSPRVQEVLGYSPEEWLSGGFDLWKDSLHPYDKEDVVRHYIDSIENDSDYSLDYRMITRAGNTIWVHDSAAIQRSADGKPLRMQGVVYDISERKNAETVMRLQSAALESADNAIIITDRLGNIQWVNPAYTRLTGYTSGEVFGNTPSILRSGMQNDTFYKNLWDTILSGKVWRGELVNKRKDGVLYTEEQTITPLFNETGEITHFIGIKQDITHRKQIEEQIHQQLERLTALQQVDRAIASTFDMKISLNILLSIAVKLLSVDAVDILLVNPVIHSLEYVSCLGFRSETSKLENLKTGKSYAGLVAQNRRMVHIPNIMQDSKNLFSDGFLNEEKFINYHGVPLIVKGQLIGVMEVFHRSNVERDDGWLNFLDTLAGQAAIALDNAQLFTASQRELTERRQAEEKLRTMNLELEKRIEERTADLRQLNHELERALRIKDEFLANMSHELRTPLNAIIGLSESLAEHTAGVLNEKQTKYIGTISESGQHLLSLINDILDLAKIEAGHVTITREKVNLDSVCQSSLRMIKQLALKKHQEVKFDMDATLGMIWADERRLKQMIVNLLSNAVKFTPENGRLGLQVRGNREGNFIQFTVWDSGIGIAEEDLPRLFKPFVQLDSHLARKSGGTGLGLALVANMASLHSGSVSVESQSGHGSRFTLTLPWDTAIETGSLSVKFPPSNSGIVTQNSIDHTLLLVDDTQESILLFKDYLEHAGYKVVTAQNGKEGVILAEKIFPSLILMDVQMPIMDGMEATRHIRKIPGLEHTPIIAMTALALSGDRERCLEAGMSDYLSKPIILKTLLAMIQAHLSRDELQK